MKIGTRLGKNKLLILSFVLVLVGGGLVWMKSERQREKEVSKWFSKTIEEFCINEMCLKKVAGEWLIVEAGVEIPADTEIVELTVSQMEEIILSDKVSENEEKFMSLGIGGEDTTTLSADGKSLEIGSISQKYDGTYVRKEDDGQVFKIKVVLDKDEMVQSLYWQIKSLTNLPRLQIKKIIMEKGEEKKEMLETENGWQDEDFVDEVANVLTEGYLAGLKTSSEDEEYKILVETEGEKISFVIGKKEGEEETIYWGSRDKRYYFEIAKDTFDLVGKAWASF